MTESVATTLTERQRYWLKEVKACEASGKTVAEYALDQGIDVKAMYAGKKTLVKKGILPRTRRPRFHRAQVVAPTVKGEWHIQLPNGVSVSFMGAVVDSDTLAAVLNTAAHLG